MLPRTRTRPSGLTPQARDGSQLNFAVRYTASAKYFGGGQRYAVAVRD